jgi:hypothetical protein
LSLLCGRGAPWFYLLTSILSRRRAISWCDFNGNCIFVTILWVFVCNAYIGYRRRIIFKHYEGTLGQCLQPTNTFSTFFPFFCFVVLCRLCTSKGWFMYFLLCLVMLVFVEVFVRDWGKIHFCRKVSGGSRSPKRK